MRSLLVFDSGYGGDMLADKLIKELENVTVYRVIDWRNAPYETKTAEEVRDLTEKAVMDYIGKVDIILIASYEATGAALQYLRYKYPDQRFMGAIWTEIKETKHKDKRRALVLTTGLVRKSREFAKQRKKWKGVSVKIKEVKGWSQLIDDGEMDGRRLRQDIGKYAAECPDYVLLGGLNYGDVAFEIQNIFGEATRVIDGHHAIIRSVKKTLWTLDRQQGCGIIGGWKIREI